MCPLFQDTDLVLEVQIGIYSPKDHLPMDSRTATVPLEVPTAMRAVPVPALRG